MWIRLRFDIGWFDLLAGIFFCVWPGKRTVVMIQAEQAWSCRHDFMIVLSVRSSFDLMLRALQLEPGAEILLSALTVPDIVNIVRLHGLTPVPVDIDEDGNLNLASLEQAISPRSRMIVVAHLFGSAAKLQEVAAISRSHQLLLVEDCAQSFRCVGESGSSESDVAMFSFGPIKTATALGGAVVGIKSPQLHQRMLALQQLDPVQSRIAFTSRLLRFTILKMLSVNWMAAIFRNCVRLLGHDFDSLVNSLGRSFATHDLVTQIRKQPSVPLLRMLRHRWKNYDFSRLARRIELGQRLDQQLGRERTAGNIYWVYPVLMKHPLALRDRLHRAGYDATCQTRMAVVPACDAIRLATQADYFLQHVVFLPWYPELPDAVVDSMAGIVQHVMKVEDSSQVVSPC